MYTQLRPCQQKALAAGLLEGNNLIVCAPTGSGKTYIAELAFLKKCKEGICVYIVPLKSLALEKYNEFKQKYPKLKIALSIGDLDSADDWLGNYDLIITTAEKMDSMIRHRARWISRISLLIVDEIHLLNDPERGPTLEVLIAILRKIAPSAQLIGLSATIGNPHELAEWLGAKCIVDNWRPVKLFHGVAFDNLVDFFGEKEPIELNGDKFLALVKQTCSLNKQALIFCPTKRSAEQSAEKLAKLFHERPELRTLAQKIKGVLSSPTSQCKKLSNCVRRGAFHHAGLAHKQKEIIEHAFRQGLIKIICCTPTLAAGVNLPAFRVLIKSLRRFDGYRAAWIPVLEYLQMAGRAGRPGLEQFGEVITFASSEREKKLILENYILGYPEDINSKLALEPVLRAICLSLVSIELVQSRTQLYDFMQNTLYGYQYGNTWELKDKIDRIVDQLISWRFLAEQASHLSATELGKRVAELYIDPLSAHNLLRGLSRTFSPIGFLTLICCTTELRPLLRPNKKDIDKLQASIYALHDQFMQDVPSRWEFEYEDFICAFKTACMLRDWIEEQGEDVILEKYGVRPGELHTKLTNAEWLCYAAHELAKLAGCGQLKEIRKIQLRLKHGIKEELLELVTLPEIGRVRARALYRAGIRSIKDFIEKKELASSIIGPKIYEKALGGLDKFFK